jgi:hypothetical protein
MRNVYGAFVDSWECPNVLGEPQAMARHEPVQQGGFLITPAKLMIR